MVIVALGGRGPMRCTCAAWQEPSICGRSRGSPRNRGAQGAGARNLGAELALEAEGEVLLEPEELKLG